MLMMSKEHALHIGSADHLTADMVSNTEDATSTVQNTSSGYEAQLHVGSFVDCDSYARSCPRGRIQHPPPCHPLSSPNRCPRFMRPDPGHLSKVHQRDFARNVLRPTDSSRAGQHAALLRAAS